MTPSQRYTHHCQEARVHTERICHRCDRPWNKCDCADHELCSWCGRFEDHCACGVPEEFWSPHDERTEDTESGKPLSNGSGFYTEEGA